MMRIAAYTAHGFRVAAIPNVRHVVDQVAEPVLLARPTVVQHDVEVVASDGERRRYPGVEVWC